MLRFLFLTFFLFLWNCYSTENITYTNYRVTEGFSFYFDGKIRNYLVHTPEDYDSRRQYPILLVFHGAKTNGKYMQEVTKFNKLAEKEKMIVVYPYGTTNLNDPSFFWNAFDCCGYAVENKIDDIGFVKKLLEIIKTDFSVDEEKIYATGFSNGGMLTIKLACEISDEFSAVAPVGAAMFDLNCNPSKPLPILFVQGQKDEVVPYAGGVGKNSSTSKAKLSAETTFSYWSKIHGCQSEKSLEDKNIITLISSKCKTELEVKMVVVKEEKHQWPDANFQTSQEVWKFLKRWKRPKKKIPV